jgi:hypothetical protein
MGERRRINKGGQVTIFIIIAIIIVAAGILIYSFYPQIKTTLGGGEKNPEAYIQTCIEQDIKDAVEKVSIQGGSVNPLNSIVYEDTKIEYLCYTEEDYLPCVVQQPMLKQHTESEIKKEIENNVDSCFTLMKESYQKGGYEVDLKKGEKKIELLPSKIVSTFNYSLTLTKGGTQRYDSFVVVLNNNLYELEAIANSIIEWEATYGEAEPTTYMAYYHNLKVEKITKGSGEKIYILTDRRTGNKFQFAIKGQIWVD